MVASSRCLTRDITATHNFEVTNFSLLDGMGIGEYVSSSTFSVGSFDWKLNFYPDGDDAEHEAAYASVFLYLAGGPTGARVKFKFTLFDKDYQVSRKRGKRRKTEKEENLLKTEASTFDSIGQEWGCSDFFDKSVLQELLLDSDDSEQHNCVKLKDACLRFIGWPDVLSAVIKTEGFEHLCAIFPLATKEILEKAVAARMEKILS
ncbi:hypothetical protein EJB05_39690, partial [Eragrostis curvula]